MAGILSDKFGRKTLIVPLLLVMSALGLASAHMPNFPLFVASRSICAMTFIGIPNKQKIKRVFMRFSEISSNYVPRISTMFYSIGRHTYLVSARPSFPGKRQGKSGGGGLREWCWAGWGWVIFPGKCPGKWSQSSKMENGPGDLKSP